MGSVDLNLFKKHVYADDFTNDDAYLQHLLDAAEEAVVLSTNRTLSELKEMGGGELPVSVVHAILVLGATWYDQRESVSGIQMHAVPDTLQALVKPFRKLTD